MSLWAVRAAGFAALALGYSAWCWLSARADRTRPPTEVKPQREQATVEGARQESRNLAEPDQPSQADSHLQLEESPCPSPAYSNAHSELSSEGGDAVPGVAAAQGDQLQLPQQPAGTGAAEAQPDRHHSSHSSRPDRRVQIVEPSEPSPSVGSGLKPPQAPVSPFASGAEVHDDSFEDGPLPCSNGHRQLSGSWNGDAASPRGRSLSEVSEMGDKSQGSGPLLQSMLSGWDTRASQDDDSTDMQDAMDVSEALANQSDSEDAGSQRPQPWSQGSEADLQLGAPDLLNSFPSIDYEPDESQADSSEPPPAARPRALSSIPSPAALTGPANPANGIHKYIRDQHRQTVPEQAYDHDPSSLMDQPAAAHLPTQTSGGKPPFNHRDFLTSREGRSLHHPRLSRESAPAAPQRWPPRRSIDLQPAPTEDVNGLLDEAVRELVSERAAPSLLGSRSMSDSNLSKRSSQDRFEGPGSRDGSGDHRSSHPVDVEADELRDRLSDVDRTNSDASAAEMGGVPSEPSTSTSRFGQEASGNSGSLRLGSSASMKRARQVEESSPLELRLNVLAGPALETSYRTDRGMTEVNVGRLESNTVCVPDNEISGHHVSMRWDASKREWQVVDLGSLNGTMLNDRIISSSNRRLGLVFRLSTDDILTLGSRTKLKITCVPHEMSQATLPLLAPKRLSTSMRHRPLHTSTTLRSDAVSRLALQAEMPLDTYMSVSALGVSASAVVRSGRGRRNKACEDVVLCQSSLPGAPCDAALFCVFDGHNGRGAADEVKALLPEHLARHLQSKAADLQSGAGAGDSWKQVYTAVDAAIQSEDGCTATTLLAWADSEGRTCFQVANVGDSSAVMVHLGDDGKPSSPARYLTADHRLTNGAERDRLQGLGITLGHGGTRLYGLNLGRCLGDRYLKVEDLGLSAQPHVSEVEQISGTTNALVIIASDGVWDVASSERVVQAAMDGKGAEHGDVEAMARAVATHAQKQHTKDDVSVVVLKFAGTTFNFSQINGKPKR